MKKTVIFFAFLFSLPAIFATPWSDNIFMLVETDTPRNIQRAIETDYSFKDFTRTSEKENLLMAALKNARGNDVIDLLLNQAKISPDTKTKSGVTALMYACQYETDIEAVQNVLFTGAGKDAKKAKRILARDKDGQTCFDYARKNENISLEVLELLSRYAEEPVKEKIIEEKPVEVLPQEEVEEEPEDAPPEEEELPEEPEPEAEEEPAPIPENTPLLDLRTISGPNVIPESIFLYDYADDKFARAAIPDSLIAIEEAERHFISDANAADFDGRTRLMQAAKDGDLDLIEDLLYSGAKINAKDNEGWTALMYAARYQKNADVTRLLLFKGANRSLQNNYGITALLLGAGYSENAEVIAALLEAHTPNSDEAREAFAYGITNLNEPSVLQAFVDKGVPLNIPYKGKTPLMLACEIGKNTETIEWLLKNGASKYQVEAATGRTAFDYAKENKKLPHNVIYWSLNPAS